MKRRELIAFLGAAAMLPFAARAQQPEHKRTIAVLMNTASDDKEGQAGIVAFRQGLQLLGWTDSDKVRMEIRWAENNVDLDRRYATELVALEPDVILASGSPSVAALQHIARALPIVFVRVSDPVGGVGGVRVQPGAIIDINSYVTHRNPKLWPAPERFEPERFAPAAVAGRHRFAYLPFGGGPRNKSFSRLSRSATGYASPPIMSSNPLASLRCVPRMACGSPSSAARAAVDVRFWPKADMSECTAHVCF